MQRVSGGGAHKEVMSAAKVMTTHHVHNCISYPINWTVKHDAWRKMNQIIIS